MTSALVVSVEETLETVGVAVLIHALRSHILSGRPDVELRIQVGTMRA